MSKSAGIFSCKSDEYKLGLVKIGGRGRHVFSADSNRNFPQQESAEREVIMNAKKTSTFYSINSKCKTGIKTGGLYKTR